MAKRHREADEFVPHTPYIVISAYRRLIIELMERVVGGPLNTNSIREIMGYDENELLLYANLIVDRERRNGHRFDDILSKYNLDF